MAKRLAALRLACQLSVPPEPSRGRPLRLRKEELFGRSRVTGVEPGRVAGAGAQAGSTSANASQARDWDMAR